MQGLEFKMYFDDLYVPDLYIPVIFRIWKILNGSPLGISYDQLRRTLLKSDVSVAAVTPGIKWLLENTLLENVVTHYDEETSEPGEREIHFTTSGIELVTKILHSYIDTQVPAADRFVSRKDNIDVATESELALESLEKALKGDNAIFINAEDRLAVSKEINSYRELLKQSSIRLASIYQIVQGNSIIVWLAG